MTNEAVIFLSLLNEIQKQNTYFFNLLEVLGKKHIINQADLEYIRNHTDNGVEE